MKLGILKTDAVRADWVPEFGEYPDMFMELLGREDPALEFVIYDVEEGELPDAVDDADAYLITGSKSSVYEDKPWIRALEDFVRQVHKQRKKLIGICFGHQLVAKALGGRTEKSDKGWGVGLQSYNFSETPAWHDRGEPGFHILASHQDQVSEVAPGSRVLASSDFCENAVCQIEDHILTFQGHPEFTTPYSRMLIENRRDQIGEAVYATGMASLAEAPQRSRVARWMVNFLKD
ncbi:MAG: GMP synthase [Pseudomonadota bacterium]